MGLQNPMKSLTHEQKTGFVLLSIFGILAIGLGFLQMRNNIYGPFASKLTKEQKETVNLFVDESARLQSIDTDRDGLSDYEEINFYETSPYLDDTDSDGILDKQEIEEGTDPLCAKGEDCDFTSDAIISATNTLDLLLSAPKSASSSDGALGIIEQGNQTNEEILKLLNDPQKLRSLLIQSGSVTKEQVDAIDDQMLLQIFKETLIEKGGGEILLEAAATTTSSPNI